MLQNKGIESIGCAMWEVMSIFDTLKIIQSWNWSELVHALIELIALSGTDRGTISPYKTGANETFGRVYGIVDERTQRSLSSVAEVCPVRSTGIQLWDLRSNRLQTCRPDFFRIMNEFQKYGRSSTASPLNLRFCRLNQKNVVENIFPAITDMVKCVKEEEEYFSTNDFVLGKNEFPLGSTIMMLNETKESEWEARYEEPFIVVFKNHGGAHVLRDEFGKSSAMYLQTTWSWCNATAVTRLWANHRMNWKR